MIYGSHRSWGGGLLSGQAEHDIRWVGHDSSPTGVIQCGTQWIYQQCWCYSKTQQGRQVASGSLSRCHRALDTSDKVDTPVNGRGVWKERD